jgi:deoxyribodipyrimidine photolyase-related protein
MACVRLILGDQLNERHSWFSKVDEKVVYVMMEVRSETDYVRHHAQKVIAIFAGMRALAEHLRKAGHKVRYFKIGDKDNQHGFAENLRTVFKEVKATRFEYQEPDEYRVDQVLAEFAQGCGLPTAVKPSEHFLDERAGVARHFQPDAKRWLMESYYRVVRKRSGLLMDADGGPAGGKWNYDHDNRKPWKGKPAVPKAWDVAHDHSRLWAEIQTAGVKTFGEPAACLLYTSDAADEMD